MPSSPSSPNGDRAPTIYDISQAADVAVSTVSKVLGPRSGAYTISAETRARVIEAARRLGYELDPALRPRRGRRTGVIAVVCGTSAPPAHGVNEAIAERLVALVGAQGCKLEFLPASTWDDLRHLLNTHPLDGCLLMPVLPPGEPDPRAPLHLPVVVLNDRVRLPMPQVLPDEVVAMEAPVAHLASLGHQRILYADIGTRARVHPSEPERESAYRQAMQSRGLLPLVWRGTPETALAEVRQRQATAVVTYNNQLAIDLVPVLRRAGVVLPRDLSLVCGTEVKASELLDLTSVVMPMGAMAERACQELFALIAGQVPLESRDLRVAPTLVCRGSTGPVPTTGPVP